MSKVVATVIALAVFLPAWMMISFLNHVLTYMALGSYDRLSVIGIVVTLLSLAGGIYASVASWKYVNRRMSVQPLQPT